MTNTSRSSEITKVLEDNAGIVHKLSLMYANSQEEAKDLRQEIIYQIIKSYERFRGESKLSTWVYKVALFTALSELRTSRKKVNIAYDLPELAEDDQEQDLWVEVLGAVRQLPPVDRSLVFLYLESKSYAEMAEIMGLSESNVGVRLTRIKQKLKTKLAH